MTEVTVGPVPLLDLDLATGTGSARWWTYDPEKDERDPPLRGSIPPEVLTEWQEVIGA